MAPGDAYGTARRAGKRPVKTESVLSSTAAIHGKRPKYNEQPRTSALQDPGMVVSASKRPNELWCADYKGEFMLADRRYCYPLMISDFGSPYLLRCEAMDTTHAVLLCPASGCTV